MKTSQRVGALSLWLVVLTWAPLEFPLYRRCHSSSCSTSYYFADASFIIQSSNSRVGVEKRNLLPIPVVGRHQQHIPQLLPRTLRLTTITGPLYAQPSALGEDQKDDNDDDEENGETNKEGELRLKYEEWTRMHRKEASEERFQIWKVHFLASVLYHEDVRRKAQLSSSSASSLAAQSFQPRPRPWRLNAFADLTPSEFQKAKMEQQQPRPPSSSSSQRMQTLNPNPNQQLVSKMKTNANRPPLPPPSIPRTTTTTTTKNRSSALLRPTATSGTNGSSNTAIPRPPVSLRTGVQPQTETFTSTTTSIPLVGISTTIPSNKGVLPPNNTTTTTNDEQEMKEETTTTGKEQEPRDRSYDQRQPSNTDESPGPPTMDTAGAATSSTSTTTDPLPKQQQEQALLTKQRVELQQRAIPQATIDNNTAKLTAIQTNQQQQQQNKNEEWSLRGRTIEDEEAKKKDEDAVARMQAERLLAETKKLVEEQAARIQAEEKRIAEEAARIKEEQQLEAKRLAEENLRIQAELETQAKKLAETTARIKAEQDTAAKKLAKEEARIKAQQKAEAKRLAEQAAQIKAEQESVEEQARIAAKKEEKARQLAEEQVRLQIEKEAKAKEAALLTIKELQDLLDKQKDETERAKQQAIHSEKARIELEKQQQDEQERREQERLDLETEELQRRSQELARIERDYTELATQRAEVEKLYRKEARLRMAAEEKYRVEQQAREKAMEVASLAAQAAQIKAEQEAAALLLAEEKARIASEKDEQARKLAEEEARIQMEKEAEAKQAALVTIKELRDLLDKQKVEAERIKQEAIRAEEARAELERKQSEELEHREQERLELETKELERRSKELAKIERDYSVLAAQRAEVERLYREEARLRIAAEEKYRLELQAREKAMEVANVNAQEVETARKEAEEVRKAIEREAQMRETAEKFRKQEEQARADLEETKRRLEEQANVAEEKRRLELEARKMAEATVQEKAKELAELREFEKQLRAEADAARAVAEKAKQLAESEAARRDIDIKTFKEEQLRLQAQSVAAKQEVEAMKQLAEAEAALRAQEMQSLRNEIAHMIDEERKRVAEETRRALEAELQRKVEAEIIRKKSERFHRDLLARRLEIDARDAERRAVEHTEIETQKLMNEATEQALLRKERQLRKERRRRIEEDQSLVDSVLAKKKAEKDLFTESMIASLTEADALAKQRQPDADRKANAEEKVFLNVEGAALSKVQGDESAEIETEQQQIIAEEDSRRKAAEQEAEIKSKQELFQRSLLAARLQNDAIAVVFALDREIADLEAQIRLEKEREMIRLEAELKVRERVDRSKQRDKRATIEREQKREENLFARRRSDVAIFRDSLLDSMNEVDAMSRQRITQSLPETAAQPVHFRPSPPKPNELVPSSSGVETKQSGKFAEVALDSITEAEGVWKRQRGQTGFNREETRDVAMSGDIGDKVDVAPGEAPLETFGFDSLDQVAVSRIKMVRLAPPEAVTPKLTMLNEQPDAVQDDIFDTPQEASNRLKDSIGESRPIPESGYNDDIVSQVLSEDFLDDELAELALILNLSGPTAETMAEGKKPVSKESKVDSFFNILSNQIWAFRKVTEQSKVVTSAVKEKLPNDVGEDGGTTTPKPSSYYDATEETNVSADPTFFFRTAEDVGNVERREASSPNDVIKGTNATASPKFFATITGREEAVGSATQNSTSFDDVKRETKTSATPIFFASRTDNITEVTGTETKIESADAKEETQTWATPTFFFTVADESIENKRFNNSAEDGDSSLATDAADERQLPVLEATTLTDTYSLNTNVPELALTNDDTPPTALASTQEYVAGGVSPTITEVSPTITESQMSEFSKPEANANDLEKLDETTSPAIIPSGPASSEEKQGLSANNLLQSLFSKGDVESPDYKIPQRPKNIPSMRSLDQAEELRSRKTIPVPFDLDSIPTISSWVENEDESITGIINNSPDFESGEEIVTAPVVERTERVLNFGRKATIVTTVSGSKYRLVGPSRANESEPGRFKDNTPMKMPPGYGFDVAPGRTRSQAATPPLRTSATFGNFLTGLKVLPEQMTDPKDETPRQADAPTTSSAFTLFGPGPRTTVKARQQSPTTNKTNAASGSSSRISSTIFGGVFASSTNLPMLSDWEQNDDGSITGYVSNRIGFEDGTLITTSPVKTRARAGRVVTTTGGSKYKLT